MAPQHLSTVLFIALFASAVSANYIGFTDTCAPAQTTYKCPAASFPASQQQGNGLGSYTTTAHASCTGVTVACFTSYDSAHCGSSSAYDKTCPKCVSNNGKSITLSCTSGSTCTGKPVNYGTGVCGDPHFAAPGGIFFDFNGERDQDFSIISDTDFQVNAHFIGERTDTKAIEHGTWLQEISMGYKDESAATHFVSVGIDQEKDFETADVFYFTFDGEDISVKSLDTAEYTWTSPDGKATITRAANVRAKAHVSIDGQFEATFYPRVESRIQLDPLGKYLDMDVKSLTISRHAHGVLGQMFRPDAVERANGTATGVEGATADYRVSSLTSYDSTFNQFNLAAGVSVKSFNIIEDGAKATRKMLRVLVDDAPVTVSARCDGSTGSFVCK